MRKLCHFENTPDCKIGGSGLGNRMVRFYGSDPNMSQDFHRIWLGFSNFWKGLCPATYIYVGLDQL
jgi:hypothetical protein